LNFPGNKNSTINALKLYLKYEKKYIQIDAIKKIEKTLLININTSEKEVNIDIEQIKQLPIPKNLMNQLIKEHKESRFKGRHGR